MASFRLGRRREQPGLGERSVPTRASWTTLAGQGDVAPTEHFPASRRPRRTCSSMPEMSLCKRFNIRAPNCALRRDTERILADIRDDHGHRCWVTRTFQANHRGVDRRVPGAEDAQGADDLGRLRDHAPCNYRAISGRQHGLIAVNRWWVSHITPGTSAQVREVIGHPRTVPPAGFEPATHGLGTVCS